MESEEEEQIKALEVSNSITREQIIYRLEKYVIQQYISASEGEAGISIKPSEFQKALEFMSKLKGFDKAEGGQDLPDTFELLVP